MSRIAIEIEAENCNAWASDLVLGMPSPLSISLYLRALLLENRLCGFGDIWRFAVGLREVARDRGYMASRPLLVYQSTIGMTEPSPLFDEDRFNVKLTVVLETTEIGTDIDGLARSVKFMPFLGGNVRESSLSEVSDASHSLRGSLVYIDETDNVAKVFGGRMKKAMDAVAIANLDRDIQEAAADSIGLDKELLNLVNGRMYYLMPLGYRALSPFVVRGDARPIKRNGDLAMGLHAFVESAHGFVRLLGPIKSFGGMAHPWWRAYTARTIDDPLIYYLKGEANA